MLTQFDWLRLCRSGNDLVATIRYFSTAKISYLREMPLGPPPSALRGPCTRCKFYARDPASGSFCAVCARIRRLSRHYEALAGESLLIWGRVNKIPSHLRLSRKPNASLVYLHDENHFLVTLPKKLLKEWFQELILYNAEQLTGLLQIFPSTPGSINLNMGEALCWVAHHEGMGLSRGLMVRIYTTIYDTLKPHVKDRQGVLTFEVADFLSLLDLAQVFRAQLYPQQQRDLFDLLLNVTDAKEEECYWGRFLGELSQVAKDMLTAYQIRNWPKERIRLLSSLLDYVALPVSG